MKKEPLTIREALQRGTADKCYTYTYTSYRAAPTTKKPWKKAGLSQDELRLLGLPYGRLASRLWDFIKGSEQSPPAPKLNPINQVSKLRKLIGYYELIQLSS